ncbi:MAG: DUF6308 family protein [Mycobacterium sp.]
MTRFGIDLAAWFTGHADKVRQDLQGYFGGGTESFTGRLFDDFAAIGDPNRFEGSDVLAVEALSVEVPSEAAAALLITDTERFNALLRQIPREQNLWEVRRLDVNAGSPADDLHRELRALRGIDWVVAGKLLAAKRPKLLPILDNVVNDYLKPPKELFWVTLHDELSDVDRREAIAEVCKVAPPHVGLLRRIDVALWRAARRETSSSRSATAE